MQIDHMTSAARRKHSLPPEWKWCKAEAIKGGALLDGGIPGTISRGPRKGQNNWRGVPLERVFLSAEDMKAEPGIYEKETGNCSACGGDGQEWRGWSAASGNRYETCRRCGGSGKAVTSC